MPELEAFFHDLRALRASAGLSLAELAERAHFPEETLAAAEAGPALPPHPVLVAYVRAWGRPAAHTNAGARPRTTPSASRPWSLAPQAAAPAPRMTPSSRMTSAPQMTAA